MGTLESFPGKVLRSAHRTAPNQELIDELEQLLADARAGDVQSMAFAIIENDGGSSSGYSCEEQVDALVLIGTLEMLKLKMLLPFPSVQETLE